MTDTVAARLSAYADDPCWGAHPDTPVQLLMREAAHYILKLEREGFEMTERCAIAAQGVTASRYGEQSEDWQTGFDRGGNAAATAIRELINPPLATANK